jgi:hypothetical protein
MYSQCLPEYPNIHHFSIFFEYAHGTPPSLKETIFEKGFGKHTGFGLFLVREILAITGISIRETGTCSREGAV